MNSAGIDALCDSVTGVGEGTVRVEVTAGLGTLPSLETEWRELFDRTVVEPSVSFGWTQALAQTQLAARDRTFMVVLRRGGRLAGVVPLYARGTLVFGQWHHILRPLAELKNTHSDLLLADHSPELVSAFLGALPSIGYRWDSLRISKLVDGHSLIPAVETSAASLGLHPRRRFRKAVYWIPLPASFADYLAARSSKFRNYARRAERKLRSCGRLDIREVTGADGFDEGYEALLQIERASWKEAHRTSIAADAKQAALYRTWGRAEAAGGHLHLQLLFLDGQPIAHNLGCIHRGTYYYLKTSYAAAHRPQSPATFLRLRLIETMIARGVRTIDFCGTPYVWEQQWADRHRWHHVLSVYANTWRGRILAGLDRWTHYSSSGDAVEHEDPRTQRPQD